jgi:hypothetical protein
MPDGEDEIIFAVPADNLQGNRKFLAAEAGADD